MKSLTMAAAGRTARTALMLFAPAGISISSRSPVVSGVGTIAEYLGMVYGTFRTPGNKMVDPIVVGVVLTGSVVARTRSTRCGASGNSGPSRGVRIVAL